MLDQGEYQLAAEETLKLAILNPDNAVIYQQRAAEIYLDSGDLYAARAVLEDIRSDNQSDIFVNRLLAAKIALRDRDPVTALIYLNTRPPAGIGKSLINEYYTLKFSALEQWGNWAEAVNNRISLSEFLETEDDIRQNTRRIWDAINILDTRLLEQYRSSSTPPLTSWLELAIINQTMLFKPEILELAVSMWKEQYPEHPANDFITREILLAGTRNEIRPGHIALCLPFSGPYELASRAIRDGFLAAWYAAKDYKPELSIYDSDALNIVNVYRGAIEKGADFIVGPLEKNAILNLLTYGEIGTATLALNQVESALLEKTLPGVDSQVPILIQFGLTPEDEARQVAIRTRSDGYKRALVITPNNDRGQRLFEAFQSQWTSSGGLIMEHVRYPESTEEYKTWVKSLLNANSSDKRNADLRNRLNRNIESDTRLRNDADVIFMAATPVAARRIVPEFRYYQTGIPIYSSSDVFTGVYNPQLDRDMDDIIFNNMPWILEDSRQSSQLQQAVNKLWSAEQSEYRKLYALGIDAYNLIPHLGRLAMQSSVDYPGETGELSLSKDGRIQRKLMWARFSRGRPVVVD